MVDLELVRDLNLRMTDLQCAKMIFCGHKLRVLGKISTSVQLIVDGKPAGNMHYKASVVQDVYKLFDTHSIAGTKLTQKLLGSPSKPSDIFLPLNQTKFVALKQGLRRKEKRKL